MESSASETNFLRAATALVSLCLRPTQVSKHHTFIFYAYSILAEFLRRFFIRLEVIKRGPWLLLCVHDRFLLSMRQTRIGWDIIYEVINKAAGDGLKDSK